MTEPNELYHYGVLGMKWGQRRARKNYEKAQNASRRAASARKGVQEGRAIARSNAKKGKSSSIVNRQIKGEQRAANKFDAKAAKYEAKAKRIESKHKARAGVEAYNRVKAQSTGKLVAKSMLMGTYGTLKYEQARAKNASRGRAALRGVLYNGANTLLTGGLLGVAEPRISARDRRK